MNENQKRDQAIYFLPEGDPGFSAKRNKLTVERSIKKYDAMRRRKINQAVDEYGERADAVISFLKAIEKGKSNNIERYFSKRTLAALRGDEIRAKLMSGMRVIKNAPQT